MSIDRSVGGFKQYLLNLTTTPSYNKWRFRLAKVLRRLGCMKNGGRERLIRFNNSVKSLLTKQQNVFEGMNIRYFGPVDKKSSAPQRFPITTRISTSMCWSGMRR